MKMAPSAVALGGRVDPVDLTAVPFLVVPAALGNQTGNPVLGAQVAKESDSVLMVPDAVKLVPVPMVVPVA